QRFAIARTCSVRARLALHAGTCATHRFTDMIRKIRFWAVHGWVGVVSAAVCWLLNWMLPGVRTAYLFFPLWLGYVLAVDALVWTRAGSSIWSRSKILCCSFVSRR